jgi:hypothetical protein
MREVLIGILNSRIENPETVFGGASQTSNAWTPVIGGNSTPGTYEVSFNFSRYTRIGRRVFLDLYVKLANSVTGGGVGYLAITGLPFAKSAGGFPIGAVHTGGVDFTTSGASLSIQFISTGASSVLYLHENVDNTAGNIVQIGQVAAQDEISASICYETDDP